MFIREEACEYVGIFKRLTSSGTLVRNQCMGGVADNQHTVTMVAGEFG